VTSGKIDKLEVSGQKSEIREQTSEVRDGLALGFYQSKKSSESSLDSPA